MTDLFVDPYSESYPPSLWAPAVPADPHNLTGNYPGIEALTDFGALEASGLYGNTGTSKPTAKFGPLDFVMTADGLRAHWDGTKWVAGRAPGAGAPPAGDEPDPVEPEIIVVDPDDAVVRLDHDADGDTDSTHVFDVDDDETEPPS